MTYRLPALLAAAAVALTVWTPDARALHPVPFPHQHAPEAAPRPPDARPRREPVKSYGRHTFSMGFGLTSPLVVPSGDPLAEGLEQGMGMSLFLGWRLSDWVGLDLEFLTAFHGASFPAVEVDDGEDPIPSLENVMMSGVFGMVRVYFLGSGFFEPYAVMGVGNYTLSQGLNAVDGLDGLGVATGVGAAFNLNQTVEVGTRVLYQAVFFDNSVSPTPLVGAPTHSEVLNVLMFSSHVRLNF